MHTACWNIDIETSIPHGRTKGISNVRIFERDTWFEKTAISFQRIFVFFITRESNYFHFSLVLEIRWFSKNIVTTTILHDSMKIIDASRRKIRETLNMLARKWTPSRRIWDWKERKKERKKKEKERNDRRWGS